MMVVARVVMEAPLALKRVAAVLVDILAMAEMVG
jgi:hypothetical protein